MFTRVQHALKRVTGRNVQLTADVHDDLEAWSKLVHSLARCPTHLRKLQPFSPACIRTTNASGSRMGGVCQDPEGQYFVCQSSFSLAIQARLVFPSKLNGYMTINDLELEAVLMQILIFAPRMVPLSHIHAYVNNTEAQGWANRGSVSTASSVGQILWELSLVDR